MTCAIHNHREALAAHAAAFTVAHRTYSLQDANFNVTALVTRFTLIGDGSQDGHVDIVDLAIVANHWQQSSGNVQWLVNERFIYDAYGTFEVLVRDDQGAWHDDWGDYLAWENFHQGLRIDRHTGTFESGRWVEGTGWYENRHRIYSATMGRFAQQDPMGYVDGMSLYAAYGDSPASRSDAFGLFWTIERNGGARARAIPGAGDTIETLAHQIGLNAAESSLWLYTSTKNGDLVPYGFGVEVCGSDRDYYVPNTVYIGWGDSYDWIHVDAVFAKWIFKWFDRTGRNLKTKKELAGYKVIDSILWDNAIKHTLYDRTEDGTLYQFYLFGHGGGDPNSAGGSINTETAGTGVAPARYTHYGLNEMLLYACDSAMPTSGALSYRDPLTGKTTHLRGNDAITWRLNVATDGLFGGYTTEVNYLNECSYWRTLPGVIPILNPTRD